MTQDDKKLRPDSSSLFVLHYVFLLFCLGGCVYQVITISIDYGQYITTSRVQRWVPTEHQAPNIAVCMRYTDVLDAGRLREEKGLDLDLAQGNETIMQELTAKLTIADLFEFTPPIDKIFSGCDYRKRGSSLVVSEDGNQCNRIYNVSKFYLQEFICYRFGLTDSPKYNFDAISSSLYFSGMLYQLRLNRTIFRSLEILKLIAFYGDYPSFSAKLAKSTHADFDQQTNLSYYNSFTVTFTLYETQLLPRPYDTNCNDSDTWTGQDIGSAICLQNCLLQALSKIKRTPFSGIISDPLKLSHFSGLDFEDPDKRKLFENENSACRQPCSYRECEFYYTTTDVLKERGSQKELWVKVMITYVPAVKINTDARTSFSEYLIYVCSCLGTWFGLSIRHLNPFGGPATKAYKRNRRKWKSQLTKVRTFNRLM